MPPSRRLTLSILTAAGILLIAAPPAREAGASSPARPVARIWKGRTSAARADEYQRYLDATGISKILATRGNRGVTVMRRPDGETVEFTVLSVWDSLDAVKQYAGENYQKAVLLPRDREYLLEVEPNVVHAEIVREERK